MTRGAAWTMAGWDDEVRKAEQAFVSAPIGSQERRYWYKRLWRLYRDIGPGSGKNIRAWKRNRREAGPSGLSGDRCPRCGGPLFWEKPLEGPEAYCLAGHRYY